MAHLSQAEVRKIAHLARLALTEEEIAVFQVQLSAVLDYAALLNELDLDDVQPSAHAVTQQNIMRPDDVEPSMALEDVLYNAAETQDDQFLIQSVLDE